MSSYILLVQPGEDFVSASNNALYCAKEKNAVIEFSFNGIKCLVDAETKLGYLRQEYYYSHLMGWKIIGPKCKPISKKLKAEIKEKERLHEIKNLISEAIRNINKLSELLWNS